MRFVDIGRIISWRRPLRLHAWHMRDVAEMLMACHSRR